MGLLDGLPATNRKEPGRLEGGPNGKVPLDRLAEIAPACRMSRARVVDAGHIISAGASPRAWRWASTLLRRVGYPDELVAEVPRVIEYSAA